MNLIFRRSPGTRFLLGTLLYGASALSQTTDAASAEALFQQGRELLVQGKAQEACPKLEESLRLDPATGTLVALAMCHEAGGKLASAWAEFTDAESRARREKREDREKLSRERAQALKPRLSTLQINVPPAVAAIVGLELKRDGAAIGPGMWNAALPIDGGSHDVEALAPGRKAWKATVAVATERASVAVLVPLLDEATATPVAVLPAAAPSAAPAPPPAPAPPAGTQTQAPPAEHGLTGLQWAGVGAAATGVVLLGVGGYFLGTALGEKSDSEKDCPSYCNERGVQTREDMVAHGNLATAFGIAGGVLAVAGGTLYFVGRPGGKAAKQGSLYRANVALGSGGGRVSLEGAF